MRCYHLCNFYLGGIQAGIQTAHTQHEMAAKYRGVYPGVADGFAISEELGLFLTAAKGYEEWADNHKTLILLNGGMAKDLLEFEKYLSDNTHGYAWSSFREEEAAINGAITNVGIVLPEKMYTKSRDIIKIADNYRQDRRFITIPGAAHTEVFVNLPGTEPDGCIVSVVMYDEQGHATSWRYNAFEFDLLKAINRCDLMR